MTMAFSLFDTLLEPVFVLNEEQKVIYCNETAALLCDLSVRKITRGLKFLDLLSFSEAIDGLADLSLVLDATPYKEVKFKTAQGGEGKVQITIQPFPESTEKNWIVFVRDVTLEERLQKKYRAELEQKEDVIKDLEEAKAQLENYSKNLEHMVAERTAEIQRMNQTMTALLDSLHQGFFIFDATGKILNVSSRACENTIECRPEGRLIWDVLKLPEKKIEGFQKWMQTIFMEMLPFEDLAPLGPNLYAHSGDRNISLEYFPLRSSSGSIDGVVVVASDITSLIEAQKQAEQDRAYANLIIKLVQNKKQIGRFIRESQSLLLDLQSGLQSSWQNANTDFLFRQLHTLKGGAALFSIQEMVEHCHQAESLLSQFKETASATSFQLLQNESQLVADAFSRFTAKCEEVLGPSALSSERLLEIPVSKLSECLIKIDEISGNTIAADVMRDEFVLEDVGSFFVNYNEVVLRLAEQQGKQLNSLQLKNEKIKVLPEFYSGLFATFIHAFRNAIDHGIEANSERERLGKSPLGTISVAFSLSSDHSRLTIQIDDDGSGINPEKIRQLLKKRNIDASAESDQEVIQHIFDSQFSTREKVTEISGRGVGMDAIKQTAEELSGKVWVESKFEKGTSLFVEVPYVRAASVSREKSRKAA